MYGIICSIFIGFRYKVGGDWGVYTNYLVGAYENNLKTMFILKDPGYMLYWQVLALLSTTIYPAYHRQHHAQKYVDKVGFESLLTKAQEEQAIVFNYLEGLLSPYLCGKQISAVDFYFYALTRWDFNKTRLREGRPNLKSFLDVLRSRESVEKVLSNQPKRK